VLQYPVRPFRISRERLRHTRSARLSRNNDDRSDGPFGRDTAAIDDRKIRCTFFVPFRIADIAADQWSIGNGAHGEKVSSYSEWNDRPTRHKFARLKKRQQKKLTMRSNIKLIHAIVEY
jgi:hypothetical protein